MSVRHRFFSVALATAAAVAPAAAQTFDFNAATVGTTTPLTQTSGGVTATFRAGPGGGFYEISNEEDLGVGFSTLTGNFLIQVEGESTPLLMGFSTPLSAISFNFATSADPRPLTLQAFLGTTLVGSVGALGAIPPGGFDNSEGVVTFVGGAFDNVRVTVDGELLAIDNMTVRPTQVIPEPGTVALTAAGLALLLVGARRRARSLA